MELIPGGFVATIAPAAHAGDHAGGDQSIPIISLAYGDPWSESWSKPVAGPRRHKAKRLRKRSQGPSAKMLSDTRSTESFASSDIATERSRCHVLATAEARPLGQVSCGMASCSRKKPRR